MKCRLTTCHSSPVISQLIPPLAFKARGRCTIHIAFESSGHKWNAQQRIVGPSECASGYCTDVRSCPCTSTKAVVLQVLQFLCLKDRPYLLYFHPSSYSWTRQPLSHGRFGHCICSHKTKFWRFENDVPSALSHAQSNAIHARNQAEMASESRLQYDCNAERRVPRSQFRGVIFANADSSL